MKPEVFVNDVGFYSLRWARPTIKLFLEGILSEAKMIAETTSAPRRWDGW